jgi:hypothetical protein
MKTATRFLALGILAILPLLQACETAASWEGTITDSAGVAIVSNTSTPMWQPGDEWTVTEDLRIGTVAGEPEYQFTNLAFIDVAPDGTIYATDNMVMEAKAFDAQGNYLRTLGGPGSGPGELTQQAVFIYVEDDGTVIIPDVGAQRVNRYSPEGEALGSFPIQIQGGVPTVWVLDDQGRLMTQLRGLNVRGIEALEEGDPIVVYDTTGAVVDTVAVLPKGQMLEGITEQQFSMVLFAPEPVWDLASDGSIFFAMNDQFQILVNDADGNRQRIIRKAGVERKPVEERDREAIRRLLREQWEGVGVPPAQIEQLMQGVGFADFYPAFGQIFIGPEETLWIQRIRSARDMAGDAEEEVEFDPQAIGSPEWEVFDDQGRFLGVVTMPDRFRPVNVQGDEIYGIWRDELDVQYIMRIHVNHSAI